MKQPKEKTEAEKPKLTTKEVNELELKAANKVGKVVRK